MKTFIHLLIPSILLFFTSCSTTYLSSGGDDVYYTPSKATNGAVANNAGANQAEKGYDVSVGSKPTTDYTTVYSDEQEGTNAYRTTQEPSDSGYEVDGSGNTYITNYYDYDDYYDYAYSSRIRRFHNCYYSGFGYYHNYYTDLYWYSYDPFYYGVSIYYGYPFWYPNYYSYYRPWGWYGYGYGFGYGYGYGYGYGHGGYWAGYHHGYWDGYYHGSGNGYYDYYYNSYDGTNSYYGSRNYVTSGDGAGRGTNQSFGQRYESAIAQEASGTDSRATRSDIHESGSLNHVRTNPTQSAATARDESNPSSTAPDSRVQESATTARTQPANSQEIAPANAAETRNQTPATSTTNPGYQRPVSTQPVRERTYTPPAYNNPAAGRQNTTPVQSRQNSETSPSAAPAARPSEHLPQELLSR
jgi:hypothetical protein